MKFASSGLCLRQYCDFFKFHLFSVKKGLINLYKQRRSHKHGIIRLKISVLKKSVR
jgi:hypothetical protein